MKDTIITQANVKKLNSELFMPFTISSISSFAISLPVGVDNSSEVLFDKTDITASLIAGLYLSNSAIIAERHYSRVAKMFRYCLSSQIRLQNRALNLQ